MAANPTHGHPREGPHSQNGEGGYTAPPFPLSVDPFRHGWCITVHLQDGRHWQLLKPGWDFEASAPYVFESPGEAWDFLRKIFLFCLKQQNPYHDKLCNCPNCGKVYRARFLTACEDCTMVNDLLMQQIWQGLYYMSGSYDEVIMRMAMLLNISPQTLMNIKSAYAMIVNDGPRWGHAEDDNPSHQPLLKRNTRTASTRRHHYGLRGK